MKYIVLVILLYVGFSSISYGQLSGEQINNLKEKLAKAKHDTTSLDLAFKLASGYRFSNVDSSILYTDLGIKLATEMELQGKKAVFLSLKGATLLESGRLPESLQFQFEAMNISEKINDTSSKAYALNRIGNTYMELADFRKANDYYFRSKDLFQMIMDTGMYHNEVSNIGNIYELMEIPDSALYYQQIVYDASLKTNDRNDYTRPEIMFRMGNAYKLKGNSEKALEYYKKGIVESYIDNDLRNLAMINLLIAKLESGKFISL